MSMLPFLLLLVAQDAHKLDVPEYPPPTLVRSEFLKLLDRPRVPLNPRNELLSAKPALNSKSYERPVPADLDPTVPSLGKNEEVLSIASEKRVDGTMERIPILISKPAKLSGKLPVVIVLHGTGGDKAGLRDWLRALNDRGIIGVAIDGRYHGRRVNSEAEKNKAYLDAITRAWKAKPDDPKAYPFYYDTCWDVWRTIDYLETRGDVDPKRIGLMGISKGGIETWLSGSVDERVKVAVPCISVQSFRWSLDNDQWQGRANTIAAPHKVAAKDRGESEITRETCRALWNKVIPGMLDQFDCPSMLRLFAGRSLLIVNGDEDPNCPIGGVKVAIASAEKAYKDANASDKLKVDIARKSGHTITDAQKKVILDWFAKSL